MHLVEWSYITKQTMQADLFSSDDFNKLQQL